MSAEGQDRHSGELGNAMLSPMPAAFQPLILADEFAQRQARPGAAAGLRAAPRRAGGAEGRGYPAARWPLGNCRSLGEGKPRALGADAELGQGSH